MKKTEVYLSMTQELTAQERRAAADERFRVKRYRAGIDTLIVKLQEREQYLTDKHRCELQELARSGER